MATALLKPITHPDLDPQNEDEAHKLIWQLLEGDRGSVARRKSIEWTAKFPESARLKRWADVLNPTYSASFPSPGRDFRADDAWFKENAHKYPGCWQAVSGGQLIAADPSLEVVTQKITEAGLPRDKVVLWKQMPARTQ
jgi:hypothetical protein